LALQLKKNAFLFSSQQSLFLIILFKKIIFFSKEILPRSPPFNCPKCGFSSRRLRPVMRHLCTRRAHEYKNGFDLNIINNSEFFLNFFKKIF